jgi:hypothetical protein
MPHSVAVGTRKASPDAKRHLRALPEALHKAALDAYYPQLHEQGTLEVDCSELSMVNAAVCLRAFASQRREAGEAKRMSLILQTVCMSVGDAQDDYFNAAWQDALQAQPEELALSNVMVAPPGLEALLRGLAHNRRLRRLKLSTVDLVGGRRGRLLAALLGGLAQLTTLQSFTMRGLMVEHLAATAVWLRARSRGLPR